MTLPRYNIHERSLRELIAGSIDSAKAYVRAEVTLVKQTATTMVERVRPAAIFIVIAVFLLQAGLTILVAALGMTAAIWLGPAGGLAVGGVVALVIAGLLAWLALGRIRSAKP